MRCSKGYSDELEKLIHSGGGVILTVELKKAATKNMRLTVIAYSQAEYWYASTNKIYIRSYKEYGIAKDDETAA